MLEVLGGGPYYVFGRPLILKAMPNFFDFKANDMTKMPTWEDFQTYLFGAGLPYAYLNLLV